MSATQIAELDRYLEQNLCETTAQVGAHVASKYAVESTIGGRCELLKRLGFVYKKPVSIPSKTDLALQYKFIEYYETIKSSIGIKDKIYFVNGVHPQHNFIPFFGWIRKGVDRP